VQAAISRSGHQYDRIFPARVPISSYGYLGSLKRAFRRLIIFSVADSPLRLKESAGRSRELLPGPTVALVSEPSAEPTYVPTSSGIGGMFGVSRRAVRNNLDLTMYGRPWSKPAPFSSFFPKPFN